ncbi:MAG: metallophosphoesterase family protein [Acidobacteriota bacterium]
MTKLSLVNLLHASLCLFAQSPAAGPDPQLLQTLLNRHRPSPQRFEFAAIGDQHYGATGIAKWPALQASINRSAATQFVVHTGDIKSGSTVCDDAMFANRLRDFNNFEMPMILTPGDNEWTDCHRENNGSYDSLERLRYLRSVFYPNNQSLGRRKLTLSQQSEDRRYSTYVENAMWSQGNILFATVHLVGSNDNLGRNAVNDAEWAERTAANFNWLKTIFSVARDNEFGGVVLVMQVNPGFSGQRVRVSQLLAGLRDSFFVLEDEVITFGRPVLVIHGDSHEFHFDKPLLGTRSGLPIDNLTRVEVPGSADVHWVRIFVDPGKTQLFGIEHVDVVENYFPQTRP